MLKRGDKLSVIIAGYASPSFDRTKTVKANTYGMLQEQSHKRDSRGQDRAKFEFAKPTSKG